MTAMRQLLQNIVDYAGLFPPAGLPLPAVVENYRAYTCLLYTSDAADE